MGVVTQREGATATVAFSGELDVLTCPDLERELSAAIDGDCETVVLDLRELAFIDSSGMRTILHSRTQARRAGKRFELVRPSGAARRALDVSGMD